MQKAIEFDPITFTSVNTQWSNRIFKLYFDNLTLGAPSASPGGSTSNFLSYLSGTDTIGGLTVSTTGGVTNTAFDNFFGSTATLRIQSVSIDEAESAANIRNKINVELVDHVDMYGRTVKALDQTIARLATPPAETNPPQSEFQVALVNGATPAIPRLFISYGFELPTALSSILTSPVSAGNHWASVGPEIKKYIGTDTAYRFSVQVQKRDSDGLLRWRVQGDQYSIPGGTITQVWGPYYIEPEDFPVRLGEPGIAELYIQDPVGGEADITTGITWCQISYADDSYVICNQRGGKQHIDGSVYRTLFLGVAYSGANTAGYGIKIWEPEVHDNFPYHPRLLADTAFSPAILFGILHGPYSYTPTVPIGIVKYVSPTGTGVGTFDDPMSIADANDDALPGDHFWLLGGTYTIPLNGIRFYSGGTSWAPGQYVTYESYPGEQAIFDGVANQAEEADVRVKLQDKFVCLRKVEVKNCSLQGIEMSSTDNKVEFCEIHDCWLSGITAAVSGGTASWPYANGRNIIRSNTIYNCSDVGHLTGSYANGGNADAISISSGYGNIVEYNLCYNCSDDGIDVWRSTASLVRYNSVYGMGLGDGNGNGFKCGGSPSGTTYSTDHIFAYNISVGNKSSGFAGNNGVRTLLYHNTTALNPIGFDDFDSTTRLVGNIASESTRYTGSTSGHSGNSWNISVGTTPTFISTNPSSSDYYKPPVGNVFEDIGAYAA